MRKYKIKVKFYDGNRYLEGPYDEDIIIVEEKEKEKALNIAKNVAYMSDKAYPDIKNLLIEVEII
ncbi:hypothetical protein HOK00_02950 [bacterium]|jgi:hypothetical protein|nr:hypothetical protein [bacterium]